MPFPLFMRSKALSQALVISWWLDPGVMKILQTYLKIQSSSDKETTSGFPMP